MATSKSSDQTASQLFLQSLAFGTTAIPREMITLTRYTEVMNLRAPVMQLIIRDVSNRITNEMGIKSKSKLVAKMGGGFDQSGEIWAENMIVVSPAYNNDTLTLILVPESLYLLCQPASKAQFFNDKLPLDIVSALLPSGVTVLPDSFPRAATYHLNMNQKPFTVLHTLADDHGARAWLARNQLNLKHLSTLSSLKPAFTYEFNNPKAKYTLTKTSNINQDEAFLEKVRFRFTGYNETDGYISVGDPSWPVKQLSNSSRADLQNKLYTLIPKLDAECEGNSALTVGMVLNVVVHRYDSDSGIDETVPKKMIIMSVTHQEDRRAYVCRMILGVVASA